MIAFESFSVWPYLYYLQKSSLCLLIQIRQCNDTFSGSPCRFLLSLTIAGLRNNMYKKALTYIFQNYLVPFLSYLLKTMKRNTNNNNVSNLCASWSCFFRVFYFWTTYKFITSRRISFRIPARNIFSLGGDSY